MKRLWAYYKEQIWERDGFLLIFLLGVSLVLFFFKLGDRTLWGPKEDEMALVSREILKLGHWIFPTVNEYPYTLMPILYNWLVALASMPGGEVTEFTSRLPSALAGLGGVLVTYLLGKRLFSRRCGFFSALTLATSLRYIQFSRWADLYMPLTFFVSLSLYLFYTGYRKEEKRKMCYLFMYISLALGTLILGPVGLVLPLLTMFFYLLIIKDLSHIPRLGIGYGTLIYSFLTVPWFLVASFKGGSTYAYGLLIMTNLERYFNTWTHQEAFYYYLEMLPLDFLPWTILLPAAFIYSFSSKFREKKKEISFPLVWFFVMLLFFSFAQGKQRGYILPLYPSLALLIGNLLDSYDKNSLKQGITWYSLYFLILMFLCLCFSVPIYAKFFSPQWFSVAVPLSIMVFIIALGSLWALFFRGPFLSFLLLVFLIASSAAYFSKYVLPKLEERESFKPFSLKIKAEMKPEESWAMYRYLRSGYIFYVGKSAKLIPDLKELKKFLASPKRVFVLLKEGDYLLLKDGLDVKYYIIAKGKVARKDVILISNEM